MKKLSKLVSLMLSLVLCAGMAAPAFAIEYKIETGRVHVENGNDGNVVSWQENHEKYGSKDAASTDKEIIITGTYEETNDKATGSVITVGQNVTDTTITLKDVDIDVRGTESSAFTIGSKSDVIVELEGDSTLKSGYDHAGLELTGGGSVTIQDAVKSEDQEPASLTAEGGWGSAGIGGAYRGGNAGNITITEGAVVTATGGAYGAGIGSGYYKQTAGNITITGNSVVTATGFADAAGIGTGHTGTVGKITITGGADVTATGDGKGPGIGGAWRGKTGDISISDAKVTATGGKNSPYWGENEHYIAPAIGAATGDLYRWSSTGKITITGNTRLEVNGCTDFGATPGEESSSSKDIEVRHVDKDGSLLYVHQPKNEDRIEYTVTPPEGKEITVNDGDLTVTIPAGSTVQPKDGSEAVTLICRGEIDKDGSLVQGSHDYSENITPATCTEDGVITYTCERCGDSYTAAGDPAGHTDVVVDARVEPTETRTGLTEGSHCRVCGTIIVAQEVIPMLPPSPGTPDGPGTDIPDPDVPMADGTGADTTTIEDQAVPLAGLMPMYMLLEELRQYEKAKDAELPEDFKWIDHEYAQAIYWGLQEELVSDTEEAPFDPDEVITVALLRDVLTNFVAYKGSDFVVTVEGEDDEIVFDLGERLTAFYGDLEAYLKAQKTKAA